MSQKLQSGRERSCLIYRLSSLIDVIRCLVTFVVYLRTHLPRRHCNCQLMPTLALLPLQTGNDHRVVQGERGCNKSRKTAGCLLVSLRSQAKIACCGDRYDPQLLVKRSSQCECPSLSCTSSNVPLAWAPQIISQLYAYGSTKCTTFWLLMLLIQRNTTKLKKHHDSQRTKSSNNRRLTLPASHLPTDVILFKENSSVINKEVDDVLLTRVNTKK